MANGLREHTGFEGGALVHLTDPGATAISEAASNVNPRSGAWHLRVDMGSFDFWEVDTAERFFRAAVGDAVGMGCAFYVANLTALDEIQMALEVFNTSTGSSAFGFQIKGDGSVDIETGAAGPQNLGTVLTTLAAGTITSGEWYFMELYWIASQTSGTWKLAINGAEVFAQTGVDTYAASGTVDLDWGYYLQLDTSGGSTTIDVDDFFVWDGHADLIGPVEHEALIPNADLETDGVVTGSANHFENVDERPPTDTERNTLTPGGTVQRERYGLTDRTLTGDVLGFSVVANMSDPDGTTDAHIIVEEAATEISGPSVVLTTTPTTRHVAGPYEQMPDAGAMDTAAMNALTVGVETAVV